MAYVTVETKNGPARVRVCDYCKSACIPSGRFCSGRCAREYQERASRQQVKNESEAPHE